MFGEWYFNIIISLIICSIVYIAFVKIVLLDTPYVCDICDEECSKIHMCIKCGRHFCNNCGNIDKKLCKNCDK